MIVADAFLGLFRWLLSVISDRDVVNWYELKVLFLTYLLASITVVEVHGSVGRIGMHVVVGAFQWLVQAPAMLWIDFNGVITRLKTLKLNIHCLSIV